jgi:putative transposase
MRNKKNGRRVNNKLGSWPPYQLDEFIRYKAEDMGKIFVDVDPRYTSQKYSKCGFIYKNNRNGSVFHCLNCCFELHADLNAARNIGVVGRSEYFRLQSTSQMSRLDEALPTGTAETSDKHQSFSEE